MDNVIEFPRREIERKGRDAAFEMLADMLIEAVSEIAELRSRVEELEVAQRRPPRRRDDWDGAYDRGPHD